MGIESGLKRKTYINSLQAASIAEAGGKGRLLQFMQCPLLFCSVFAPLEYSISQIYAIYIVRPHCSIQFAIRNLLKSPPQLLMISCGKYSGQSRADLSRAVEVATTFVRTFCRPHYLPDIHLETPETRHFVSVTITITKSDSTQLDPTNLLCLSAHVLCTYGCNVCRYA